jgi:hypothetical protein
VEIETGDIVSGRLPPAAATLVRKLGVVAARRLAQ